MYTPIQHLIDQALLHSLQLQGSSSLHASSAIKPDACFWLVAAVVVALHSCFDVL
jgi:hypothetical protein